MTCLASALACAGPASRAQAPTADPITVTSFTPQGPVKGVRQVVAHFSAPVVNFGDPRTDAPFDVDCPAAGHGRWSDASVWIYDFDADLPGALACRFTVRKGATATSGTALAPAAFTFNTGGPAVLASYPNEGTEWIDENQAFLLALDTPADTASVRAHAYCDVAGVGERVPVTVLEGKARDELVTAVAPHAHTLFAVLTKRGFLGVLGMKDPRFGKAPLVVLRCARPLPPGARVTLVWGAGVTAVAAPGKAALATDAPQSLPFSVRNAFTARQDCERVNAKAGCVPVLPIGITFSAPVRLDVAAGMTLRTADGTVIHPQKPNPGRGAGTARDATVEEVRFPGPFPARSTVTIELPKGFADDAGRPLANSRQFPLRVDIDEDPPLVKVSAPFGILEANADPALPVSVRNIEANLASWHVDAGRSTPAFPVRGASLRVNANDDAVLAGWMKRLLLGPARDANDYSSRPGERPLLTEDEAGRAQRVALPVPGGSEGLQLIGVPLPEKGLHVLQFASNRLGAVLHGENRPYYVYAGALVTNLAVHFKRGRESSLAWVTRLDNAQPVSDARVQVDDCLGHTLWAGQTDANGLVRIAQELPQQYRWRECPHAPTALLVTARAGDDMSLLLTSWSEGLNTWQFNLAGGVTAGPIAAHTVTDRPLFRAGETVSMKHYLRRRTSGGFAAVDADALPGKATITHLGSDQRYEIELHWQGGTALSTWKIPAEAKAGTYAIALVGSGGSLSSGEFRVEQFRVPLMRAVLRPPPQPLVHQDTAEIVAQLSYLAGGPAAGQTVKLRSRVVPYALAFPAYDDFHFGGEAPQEGLNSAAPAWMNDAPDEDEGEAGADEGSAGKPAAVATRSVTLDASGGATVRLDKLPMPGVGAQSAAPQSLDVEMEYADPNGQILTAGTSVPLLPARLALGMKVEGYFSTADKLAFKVLALDTEGRPQADKAVDVQAYQRTRYAYRKRLLGGFYAYEQSTEVRRIGPACAGRTDARGLLVCEGKAPGTGELILVARARDAQDHAALASIEAYVAGKDDEWFEAGASDRIDLLPDRRAYEPGETARFEVRMPFRHATALVTVEREGVLAQKVVSLDASAPYIDVPMVAGYGPNVYVSALVIRGRVGTAPGGVAGGAFVALQRLAKGIGLKTDAADAETVAPPTGLVDLGKPAYRLGLTQVRVGWSGYALQVKVEPEKTVYPVRGKVPVTITVTDPAGRPVAGSEVALAAVDEGLLALRANASWDLLGAMMQRRPEEVQTATAQGEVIGKRHFGKKAAAPGGGGGSASARELFDTLLLWQGRVPLDAQGRAHAVIPLNDALSSFRIEAVASAGPARFGSGSASVRTTQDLMLFAGVSPFVREGDRYVAQFTVRNAGTRALDVDVAPVLKVLAAEGGNGISHNLAPQRVTLAAGAAQTVGFEATAPVGSQRLEWTVQAQEHGAAPAAAGAQDRLVVSQAAGSAYPVRVYQQTLLQLEPGKAQSFPVELPLGALPGRGGIDVRLARSLGGDDAAIREWAHRYPYICLEQRASTAVIEQSPAAWERVMQSLPAHLDGDGLARYFPVSWLPGDDGLTAYILAIAHEAGYPIADGPRQRMIEGLGAFVQGRISRWGALPTADLAIRKIAAIEALARYDAARPEMLDSIEIRPDLWPSSAVIDWLSVLERLPAIPDRDARREQARQILHARLTYSGTTLLFSTEKSDYLWWLMVSPDRNATRALLLAVNDPALAGDAPRLARGALGRQLQGHWNTTVANAWGVLALHAFQAKFERDPVSGVTQAGIGAGTLPLDWNAAVSRASNDPTQGTPIGDGPEHRFDWPAAPAPLTLRHEGTGRPWALVAARAALPLAEPLSAGYAVKRTVTAVDQQHPGTFTRGDVLRIRLDIEAQQDMTWVAVSDPVPAGATVLGTGLGGDSALMTQGEKATGAWPAFEERTFEGYRAYYAYLPKGHLALEYTVRLNNAGHFEMPATRVEAMYAPEIFGEFPVARMEIAP